MYFGERGYDVAVATGVDDGLVSLADEGADVVISDIRMPSRNGFELLDEIGERFMAVPVIMMTAFQDLESTVAAMQGGAVDYVPKPIDLEELEAAVERALEMRSEDDVDGLVVDLHDSAGLIVGISRPMKDLFKSIGMVSQSRVTVLIYGESGTGKELTARAIHAASQEFGHPFVAVNCAALVETLLESEMFGHEKGAFTGAMNARKGKVEMAGDGTLFLDEISELSPRMQGKLLRLLEEREYSPVGSNDTLISDARFITATNTNLAKLVEAGKFREDLYYRLNVVNIVVPPLRERREDIPPLVGHLLNKINREIHKCIRRVPSDVMDALVAYDWPGNVRQLENTLMKAVVLAQGHVLTPQQLPEEIFAGRETPPEQSTTIENTGADDECVSLKQIERDHIQRVLARTGWHKGQACEILGISRPRLDRRIKEYDLIPDQRRAGG